MTSESGGQLERAGGRSSYEATPEYPPLVKMLSVADEVPVGTGLGDENGATLPDGRRREDVEGYEVVDQGGPMSDGVEKIAQQRRSVSESMGGRLEGNFEHILKVNKEVKIPSC